MDAHRLLPVFALLCVGLGAPFVFDWGLWPCLVGAVLGVAALFVVPQARSAERRVAWAATVGGGLALSVSFTVQVAAPNIVVAGQKAAGRQAVATLRTVLWAQDQMITGHGRAGFLAEMSGVAGIDGGPPLSVPLLRDPFRRLKAGATGGVIDFGGYTYQVWVVGPGLDAPLTDAPPGDAPHRVAKGAVDWLAYAWPTDRRATGYRVFCLNRYEDILELSGEPVYTGLESPPAWDACVTGDDPRGRLSDGTGRDGRQWARWRGKDTRRSRSTPTPTSTP